MSGQEISAQSFSTNSSNATTIQPDTDWQYYGRDENATRYSPLIQVTPDNVNKLEVAWTYRTGDVPQAGQTNKWAAETTPIKVGNAVYLCSATIFHIPLHVRQSLFINLKLFPKDRLVTTNLLLVP